MSRTICELKGPKGAPKTKVTLKPPIQRLQSFWKRGRFYERDVLSYIHGHYQGGVFIDAGSNVGNHTLFFAMYCNPSLIISIEPVASYLEHQRENLALNGLGDKVHCFNVALSDASGKGKMVKSRANPRATTWQWHQMMHELVEGEGPTVVTTLDELLPDVRGVTLLKIDVEGHELKALAGATKLLQRERPALFLEALTKKVGRGIAAFLQQFGYGPGKRVYPRLYEFRARE